MPDTEVQGSTAVVETDAAAQPSAQSAPGGSGQESTDLSPSDANAAFRALLASGGRQSTSVTSNLDAAAPDGEPAPRGDETPSAPDRGTDGRYIPRRGIPKAVEEAERRAADLERQLADRDPVKLREQWESERQQAADNAKLDELAQSKAADVTRYRRLLEVPDADLSGEDYQFREDFKERLRLIPEVESAHRELARQTIESERTALATKETNFLNGIYDQVATLAQKAGIPPEQWKAKGVTFAVMAEDYANAREAAVRAELAPRIRDLEDQVGQFRLTGARGLGAARTGLNGGVSGSGEPAMNANEIFRRLVRGEPVA